MPPLCARQHARPFFTANKICVRPFTPARAGCCCMRHSAWRAQCANANADHEACLRTGTGRLVGRVDWLSPVSCYWAFARLLLPFFDPPTVARDCR